MMGGRCLQRSRGLITFKLCPADVGTGFTVEANDARGGLIARAQLETLEQNGKELLRVAAINTEPGVRRTGVGTVVYELALEKACELGRQLVSDFDRSEWAEAFWRKQKSKGRAQCLGPNTKGAFGPNYNGGPRESTLRDIRERCIKKFERGRKVESCVKSELKALSKTLPKPRKDADGKQYWPCRRYGIKKSLCKQRNYSLDGVASPAAAWRPRKPKQVKS